MFKPPFTMALQVQSLARSPCSSRPPRTAPAFAGGGRRRLGGLMSRVREREGGGIISVHLGYLGCCLCRAGRSLTRFS